MTKGAMLCLTALVWGSALGLMAMTEGKPYRNKVFGIFAVIVILPFVALALAYSAGRI